jgi:hypothetical protein
MKASHVNVAWTLIAQIAEKGVPFIVGISLVRALDVQDYSNYAFVSISVLSIVGLATMGIQASSTKLERMIADGMIEHAATLDLLKRYALCQALAVVIFGVASAPIWFPNPSLLNICVLAVASFGLSLSTAPVAKLVAHRKFKEIALISLMGSGILSIGAILSYLHKSSISAQCGLAGSSLIVLIFARYFSSDEGGHYQIASQSNKIRHLSLVLSKVAPLAAASAISALTNLGLAKIMSSTPGGLEGSFAAYAVGMQWYAMAQFLPSILNRVSFPDVLSQVNNMKIDQESPRAARTQHLRESFIAAVVTASLICLFSAPLAWLYSASFVTPTLIMAFAVTSIITAPINAYGNVIIAKSKENGWLGCTLLWSLTVLVTAFYFRDWGAYGASLALALGGICQLAASKLLAR